MSIECLLNAFTDHCHLHIVLQVKMAPNAPTAKKGTQAPKAIASTQTSSQAPTGTQASSNAPKGPKTKRPAKVKPVVRSPITRSKGAGVRTRCGNKK